MRADARAEEAENRAARADLRAIERDGVLWHVYLGYPKNALSIIAENLSSDTAYEAELWGRTPWQKAPPQVVSSW